MQRPQHLTSFDVAVRAHNDARVALSPGPQDTAGMIEIVLGGHQNTRSWISTSKMGEPVASSHTAKILSWDEFRTFWISWRGGRIQAWLGWPGWTWEPRDPLTFATFCCVRVRWEEWGGGRVNIGYHLKSLTVFLEFLTKRTW